MKLGGVKIINLDSLKGKFDLEEVWGNIENGVLLDCQRDLARQGADLAGQIVTVLESLEREKGLDEVVSDFYRGGKWDLEGLEKGIKPFSTKSRDHSGNDFYSRNREKIQKLVEQGKVDWDGKTAAMFFLFLLMMLQVKPRAEIAAADFVWIHKKLKTLGGGFKEARRVGTGFRIYPYGSGVLYLKEGRIVNQQGRVFSPKEEQIDFFTYTERLGIIAFTKQGEISGCTETDVRYGIERRRAELAGGKIVMAAAYGGVYLLLTADGEVVSNVLDRLEGWKKIRWVGAGLNSITAVREKNGSLLELGSDSKITEFSDVAAAYTWSEGKCRYGILKENQVFIMEDGSTVEGVCAASLDRDGYVYAVGGDVFFRPFEGDERKIYQVQAGGRIGEVRKYHSKVYFLVDGGTGEEIQEIELLF